MTHTPFLAWLSPHLPRLHVGSGGVKAGASFLLVWAVQVAVAILLLPALLVVLVICVVGIVIVWLAGAVRKLMSIENRSEDV